MRSKIIFIWIALFCSTLVYAQTTLSGKIVSATDSEPLSGVAVYLSGTSFGSISGLDGTFEIDYPENINAPLVFRMMGYEKIIVDDPLNTDYSLVKLVEKPDELDAVYIANDDWSRAKKERYFKKYFLGRTPAAQECQIKNLEKVRLQFNPATHTLTASSREPVEVINKILGYTILCDIDNFEILFEPLDLSRLSITGGNFEKPTHRPMQSYMQISTYFNELPDKRPSKRRRARNRKRLFKVSEMKFYRSLISETLKDDGYHLLYDREVIPIEDHVRVRKVLDKYEISFRQPEYIMTDRQGNQSFFKLSEQQKIIVDSYGNCLSPRSIFWGDFLGKLHVSGMLPLDYNHDPEK